MQRLFSDKSAGRVVVRFSEHFSKFVFNATSEEWDFDRDQEGNPHKRAKYEVIGNIHQNPELLESEK